MKESCGCIIRHKSCDYKMTVQRGRQESFSKSFYRFCTPRTSILSLMGVIAISTLIALCIMTATTRRPQLNKIYLPNVSFFDLNEPLESLKIRAFINSNPAVQVTRSTTTTTATTTPVRSPPLNSSSSSSSPIDKEYE